MKFILGQKEKMTQLFDESGKVVPGTIVSAGPLTVLQVKKGKLDSAVVGYGERKLANLNKPQREMIKKAHGSRLENSPRGYRVIREFNNKKSALAEMEVGQTLDVSTFAEGEKVVIKSVSKGKGFQGVVKRHGFKGGRRSHGQKHSEREPGSIGAGGKQRVFPGMRMAGRMGGDLISAKNLTVARVDAVNNLIFIKGAIPGRKGTLVEIIGK